MEFWNVISLRFQMRRYFYPFKKKKSISHALDSCETLMLEDMSILLTDINCTLTIPVMGLEVGWAPQHLIRRSGSSVLFLQIRYNSCSPQAPKAMYQCNNLLSISTFTNNCKDLLIWFSSAALHSAECWQKCQLRGYETALRMSWRRRFVKRLLSGTSTEKHAEHFLTVAYPAPCFVHRPYESQCFGVL